MLAPTFVWLDETRLAPTPCGKRHERIRMAIRAHDRPAGHRRATCGGAPATEVSVDGMASECCYITDPLIHP